MPDLLLCLHPFKQRRSRRPQEIAEQMHGLRLSPRTGGRMQLRAQFDAANQRHTFAHRHRLSLFVTGEGVMIGNRDRFQPGLFGSYNQLFGRPGAIGRSGMCVKVDQGD